MSCTIHYSFKKIYQIVYKKKLLKKEILLLVTNQDRRKETNFLESELKKDFDFVSPFNNSML